MFAIKACLYCVFTERCNQCNCERVFLTEMSVLFLPAWVQVGTCWIFFSQCFSFPNVNASLDLYRPLYTLLFFTFFFFLSFLFFLDQMQKNKGSFSEWDVSSDLCQRRWSLREKTVCSYPERAAEHTSKKKKMMASLAVGARRQCSPRPRAHLVEVKKKKKSLLHLKIWTLLVNLFDLTRAPREGLFLLIGGVYMLRAHNIPYYWYCQCVCHSAAITSFMGHGKQTVTMSHHGDGPLDCATQIVCVIKDRKWGRFPSQTNEKHTSIKGESHLMFLTKRSLHFQLT